MRTCITCRAYSYISEWLHDFCRLQLADESLGFNLRAVQHKGDHVITSVSDGVTNLLGFHKVTNYNNQLYFSWNLALITRAIIFWPKDWTFWPKMKGKTKIVTHFDLNSILFNLKTGKFWSERPKIKFWTNFDLKRPKFWRKIDFFF